MGEKREVSEFSPHRLALTPGFNLMPCLSTPVGLPSSTSRTSQLCPPAVLSLCFLQSERLSLSNDFIMSLTIHYHSCGSFQEISGTNRPFSYQSLFCRPLEYKFLHSAKSFTTLLSSLFSRNQWKYYFGLDVHLTFLHVKFTPLEIYFAI